MGQKLSEERLVAIELGECYRRLNYEIRRMHKKSAPTDDDLRRIDALRVRIAALKRGVRLPAGNPVLP